jgi:hypothetical protein
VESSHLPLDRTESNASSRSDLSDEEAGETHVGPAAKRVARLIRRAATKSKISELDFYPISDLQRILTTYNVQQVLKETIPELAEDESKEELNELIGHICGTPRNRSPNGQAQRASRQRLFAILILGEKAQSIRCLVDCGVDDSDLPLQIGTPSLSLGSDDSGTDSTLYTRGDHGFKRPLKCFGNWSDHEVEWFIDKQYAALCPFFDLNSENVCRYLLHQRIILPFTEYAQAGEGGQASVHKISIHPAHHNFRGRQVIKHNLVVRTCR